MSSRRRIAARKVIVISDSDSELDDGPLHDEDEFDELESDSEIEEDKASPLRLVRDSLALPSHRVTSVESLNQRLINGDIDLDAPYQRDVVWKETKMEALIQSLMLNYYIPPIVFAVEVDALGVDKLICIDGKQRCTSIKRFMAGQIPFVSHIDGLAYYYKLDPGAERGKKARELPDVLKKRFDRIQLATVEYRGISDLQQRDVFQRVQLGVALSSAEQLQAISSPTAIWITELCQQFVKEPGTLGHAFRWFQNRDQPFQNIAAFVRMAHTGAYGLVPGKKVLDTFLHHSGEPDHKFKSKVEMAMALFVKIATEHVDTAINVVTPRVAPAEWVYAALLIYTRMEVMSIARLAKALGDMRTYVRVERGKPDIRSNAGTCAVFAEYLQALRNVTTDGEIPAAREIEGGDAIREENGRAGPGRPHAPRSGARRSARVASGSTATSLSAHSGNATAEKSPSVAREVQAASNDGVEESRGVKNGIRDRPLDDGPVVDHRPSKRLCAGKAPDTCLRAGSSHYPGIDVKVEPLEGDTGPQNRPIAGADATPPMLASSTPTVTPWGKIAVESHEPPRADHDTSVMSGARSSTTVPAPRVAHLNARRTRILSPDLPGPPPPSVDRPLAMPRHQRTTHAVTAPTDPGGVDGQPGSSTTSGAQERMYQRPPVGSTTPVGVSKMTSSAIPDPSQTATASATPAEVVREPLQPVNIPPRLMPRAMVVLQAMQAGPGKYQRDVKE